MSDIAVGARSQLDRARFAVNADTFAIVGVSVLFGALALVTWGTWGDLDSDTGYDVVAATRLADGELIYRDFVYYYGPLAPAVMASLALAVGSSIWPAIILGLAVTAAIVAATYVLGRALAGTVGGVLAAAITAAVAFTPDNYSYVLPHTTNMTLGMLLVLGLLLSIWRYATTLQSRWLVGIGGALGLLTLAKPEPALAAGAATLLWLTLRARRGNASFSREGALVLLPAVFVATVVYGVLAALTGPRRLLLENLYPVDYLEAAGNVELRGRMPFTLASFVELAGHLLLYGAGVGAMLAMAYAIARPGRLRRVAIAVVVLAALAAVAASLANPEALRHGLQYVYAWIPAGAAALLAVLVVRRIRGEAWDARAQLELAGCAALAVLAATTYPGFFPHAPHEQMAAYYIPLAAVFLARLHLVELAPWRSATILGTVWIAFVASAGVGLALKDAREDSVEVHGAGGTLSESVHEARLYQAAVDWIERETRPGEPIFVAPMMTGLYALSQRASSVDEISMLPGALGSADAERRAIAALDESETRLVLTDDRTWPGYGHGAIGETFDRELMRWLRSNFQVAAGITIPRRETVNGVEPARTLQIWLRRS
jgi:hypothetical protein